MMREKEWGNNKTSNSFKFQNYKREFHNIDINRRRENFSTVEGVCLFKG